MTYDQAIKPWGDYRALAKALRCPPTTVHSWRTRGVPIGRQFQIEVLSGGKARADRRPQ